MLLTSSPSSPSGLRCKVRCNSMCNGGMLVRSVPLTVCCALCQVADFGMSREIQMTAPLETASYGTVTHSA